MHLDSLAGVCRLADFSQDDCWVDSVVMGTAGLCVFWGLLAAMLGVSMPPDTWGARQPQAWTGVASWLAHVMRA